jgi:hypothetical protein
MKNYKDNLLGALYMLKNVMENYDLDIAHNILIDGGTDQTEDDMEQEVCEYIDVLDELIKETWSMKGNPELISMSGEKLSK